MGALEGFVKQIRELLNSMTPSARIMAGLMTAVSSSAWAGSFRLNK